MIGEIERIIYCNYERPNSGSILLLRVLDSDKKYKVKCDMQFPTIGQLIEFELVGEPDAQDTYDIAIHRLYTAYNVGRLLYYVSAGKRERKVAEFITNDLGADATATTLDEVIELVSSYKDQVDVGPLLEHLERLRGAQVILDVLGNSITVRQALDIAESAKGLDYHMISENPYRLVDYYPYTTGEQLDRAVKILETIADPYERIRAYALTTLWRRARDYHLHTVSTADLIGLLQRRTHESRVTIHDSIVRMLDEGDLLELDLDGMKVITCSKLYEEEEYIADRLLSLMDEKAADEHVIREFIAAQKNSSVSQLSEEQINAVVGALTNPVTIITGGPGTGKSTIVASIAKLCEGLGYTISLLAPTGRAAVRIGGSTIHSQIGWKAEKGSKRIVTDYVLVDEASMLNQHVFAELIKQINDNAHLILVGDVDQLPAIGTGNILNDLITCGLFPVYRLTNLYRQTKESNIVELAHYINKGDVQGIISTLNKNDVQHISGLTDEQMINVYDYLSSKVNDSAIMLTPYRQENMSRSLVLSTYNCNNQIAKRRYGSSANLHVGEPVMILENNYDHNVYNGLIGRITGFLADGGVRIKLPQPIRFNNEETSQVELSKLELYMVDRAYVSTVHKAQGMEYDIVVIPIVWDYNSYWTRQMLYTAVTRAKKQVVILSRSEQEFRAAMTSLNKNRQAFATNLLHILTQRALQKGV